jgi:hypothetical protein
MTETKFYGRFTNAASPPRIGARVDDDDHNQLRLTVPVQRLIAGDGIIVQQAGRWSHTSSTTEAC